MITRSKKFFEEAKQLAPDFGCSSEIMYFVDLKKVLVDKLEVGVL
jgi:hypothetical protein